MYNYIMIASLTGKITLKKDKFIILDVAGVGYKVFISKNSILNLPEIGQTIKLFTYLKVAETVLDLYGFITYDELEFFDILNDIRGVGPKASLEISALGSLDKIRDKILKQDEKIFAGIPGIGAKRASSIILELTGKIKTLGNQKFGSSSEEESALIQLGFSKQQARDALSQVSPDIKNPEDRIKIALKNIGK
jgi:Holliday junction DNA helicase RuvA